MFAILKDKLTGGYAKLPVVNAKPDSTTDVALEVLDKAPADTKAEMQGAVVQPTAPSKMQMVVSKLLYPLDSTVLSHIRKGGDEDDGLPKLDKYQPMTGKHLSKILATYGVAGLLSFFFQRAPTLPGSQVPYMLLELAGALSSHCQHVLPFFETLKPQLPGFSNKNVARVITYGVLPAAYAATQLTTIPVSVIDRGLKVQPLLYLTVGQVRHDMEYLNFQTIIKKVSGKIPSNIAIINRVETAAKMVISGGVMALTGNNIWNSAAAVFYKSSMRSGIDEIMKSILTLTGNSRRAAMASYAAVLTAGALLGIGGLTQNWPTGVSGLLVLPFFDTFFRLIKANMKDHLKAEKKAKKQAKKAAKAAEKEGVVAAPATNTSIAKQNLARMGKIGLYGLSMGGLGMVAGLATSALGTGFASSLLVDFASLIKVLSKDIPGNIQTAVAGFYLAIVATLYLTKEMLGVGYNNTAYSAAFGIFSFVMAVTVYSFRKDSTPKKVKKDKTAEVAGEGKKEKKEKKDKKEKPAQVEQPTVQLETA